MKVGKFFKKLFPCLSKQEEPPQPVYNKEQEVIIDHIVNDLVDDRRQYFQEELCKERQRKLEELRLEELKQQQELELEKQRLENEQKAKEEFERILQEAEERARKEEEEEQRKLEELLAYEEAQRIEKERLEQEQQRLLEEEKQKAEQMKTIVQAVFVRYKEHYHEFFSTRPQPIHSNFNEKMFKELCSKFTFSNEEELEQCLKEYNLMQKQNKTAYNQLSRKRRLKCDVFNFYLFIDCNHV